MNRDISINLSAIGFSDKYELFYDGRIVANSAVEIPVISNGNIVTLEDSNGKKQRITIKSLYRKAFDREYCKDNIESLYNEEWEEIEGTRGRYYISNYGRLKSYCKYNAILVKPYKNQYGYLRADIWIDGKRRTVLIHRLVATSFIENDNPEEKDTVDHIDGNKHNNSASNLRWLSRSENVKAFYSGLVEQMIA